MADKKISQLTDATALTGSEQIPIVQSSSTVKTTAHDLSNIYISKAQTAQAGGDVDLDASDYDTVKLIKLTWSGANGTAVYTLPDATTHTNRIIRFISDSTFNNSTHVELTPKSGQTLDGSANDYDINKSYEGIAIWSDGTEWFIIQKKA
tara:strand:+ start:137 stop:586 length:450 start_codon:yes stop_codon:yes gene_type:complete